MERITHILLLFLLVTVTFSTFNAQVKKECEYVMVVSTGPSKGPTYKLQVIIEAIGGENINTTNAVKKWGNMGSKHTYFLPNSVDIFKTYGPCLEANFCNIWIAGKKGELKPHWYINNITVSTKGDGVNRMKTFSFLLDHEVAYTNPPVSYGECP